MWSTALVEGASMRPTLRAGDCLLVRPGAPARAGDLVVARFDSRPHLLVVKRAVRAVAGGWWVEGDAPADSDDSRTLGPAQVSARVVLRYWPLPPLPPRLLTRLRRDGRCVC